MTVACGACGRQWPRHPALASAFGEVECPKCGAAVGADCIRPSGHTGPLIELHTSREQLALDRGVLELCPRGPTITARRRQTSYRPALLAD